MMLPGVMRPLQVGRLDAFAEIFRMLQVYDRGMFVPFVTPHVQPVAVIPLDHGERFIGDVTQGAVAGQQSFMQLLNPAGSGVDVYVERAVVRAVAAFPGHIRFDASGPFGVAGNAPHNKRRDGMQGVAQNRTGASPAPVGTFGGRWFAPANNTLPVLELPYPGEIALTPGTSVILVTDAVNTAIEGWWEWRECPLSVR